MTLCVSECPGLLDRADWHIGSERIEVDEVISSFKGGPMGSATGSQGHTHEHILIHAHLFECSELGFTALVFSLRLVNALRQAAALLRFIVGDSLIRIPLDISDGISIS